MLHNSRTSGRNLWWLVAAAAVFLAPYGWLLAPAPFGEASATPASARFARALPTSAWLATVASGLAAMIGGGAALLVSYQTRRVRRAVAFLFLAILAIPTVVYVVGFVAMAAKIPILEAFLFSFTGGAVVLGWVFSPFVYVCVRAGEAGRTAEWQDAPLLEASPTRILLRLRLPAALGAIFAGGVVAWVLAFGNLVVPDLLFARDVQRLPTLPTEIQTLAGAYSDLAGARRLALLSLCVPLLVTAGVALILAGRMDQRPLDATAGASGRAVLSQSHRPLRLASCMVNALCALPLAVALAGLVAVWLRDPRAALPIWRSASDELGAALMICGACAAGCVAIGVVATWWAARHLGGIGGIAFLLIASLPFVLPRSVLGMSLLWLFSTPPLIGLRDTLTPLAIAYLLVTPALAWPILFLAHSRVPDCLIEAAALEGCGAARILRSIVAPLSAAAWLSAFGIAFLVCLAETGAAMMLCPPGFTPLSVRILTMMHYGPGPYLAALCLMLFSLSLLLIASLSLLLFGWRARRL